MRLRNLLLFGLVLLFFGARNSGAAEERQAFVCYRDAAIFKIIFNGPRFADRLQMNTYSKELVSVLLELGEENLQISASNIATAFETDQCDSTERGNVILSCEKKIGTWDVSSFGFEFSRVLRPGLTETVTVRRRLKVNSMSATITTENAHDALLSRDFVAARLTLKMDVDVGGRQETITRSEILGEWTNDPNRSNYNRCVFVNQDLED